MESLKNKHRKSDRQEKQCFREISDSQSQILINQINSPGKVLLKPKKNTAEN